VRQKRREERKKDLVLKKGWMKEAGVVLVWQIRLLTAASST